MIKNVKYTSVRNPYFANEIKTRIHCLVKFDHIEGEVPFIAAHDDIEPHGFALYRELMNGNYGPIKAYSGIVTGTRPDPKAE